MKLSNIILNEYGEFKAEENQLEKALNTSLSRPYRIHTHMGAYNQDREDGDPLKGKGYGNVEFFFKDELPEEDFKKAKEIIASTGYEVLDDQSSNYFEEDPGERYYFPKIKFHFNL